MIRLENAPALPDGAEVRVEVVASEAESAARPVGASLYDRLRPVVGAAKELPPDASVNVDHYLYGHPAQ